MQDFKDEAKSLRTFIREHLIEEESTIPNLIKENVTKEEDNGMRLDIFMKGGPKFLSWLVDPM